MWWSIVIQSKQWLCGFLSWRFDVSPREFEWQKASCHPVPTGESLHFIFYLHVFPCILNRDRIFYGRNEMSWGSRIAVLCGFLACIDAQHGTCRNILFFSMFVRRTGNNAKTFNSSGSCHRQARKKLVRCRAGALEYRGCRVWHVTSRLLPSYRDYRSKFRWLFRVQFFFLPSHWRVVRIP